MIDRLRKSSFLYFYFSIIFIFNVVFYIYIEEIYLQPIFGFLLPLVLIFWLLKFEEKKIGFKKNNKNKYFEEKRFIKRDQRTYSSYQKYKESLQQEKNEFSEMLLFFKIDENFNLKELKKAYREKMKKIHPDNNHSLTAHSDSVKANNYFNKLKNKLRGKI